MGDNKTMLNAMNSLDKMIKSVKNNTPKQVSYLVKFSTTEEDFSKEREELFKAQLSAFMRDNIPMDIPEIIPYERKPISLEKEKVEEEKNAKVNDLPPVHTEHSKTPVGTFVNKAKLDLMSAKHIRLVELYSEYKDGSIGKSEYVEESIQTFMNATDPVIVNHDGDIFAGTLEYDLSKEYEYRIFRIKPRVDIHTSKLYHALRIELVPKNILVRFFSPWKKKMWDVEIAIYNASTLKTYPIDSLSLVNFPYDWYEKTDIFGNSILNTFMKLIHSASLNVNKSQKYTFWDHVDDLI